MFCLTNHLHKISELWPIVQESAHLLEVSEVVHVFSSYGKKVPFSATPKLRLNNIYKQNVEMLKIGI
jgi:hypothetical protein